MSAASASISGKIVAVVDASFSAVHLSFLTVHLFFSAVHLFFAAVHFSLIATHPTHLTLPNRILPMSIHSFITPSNTYNSLPHPPRRLSRGNIRDSLKPTLGNFGPKLFSNCIKTPFDIQHDDVANKGPEASDLLGHHGGWCGYFVVIMSTYVRELLLLVFIGVALGGQDCVSIGLLVCA